MKSPRSSASSKRRSSRHRARGSARRHERVVRDDLHLQTEGAARDLAADPAEAEDAERLVGELDAAPTRSLPAPFDQRCVGLRDVAGEREKQADGVFGGGDDVRLGRVRDDDPAARGGVDVDVVDPHPRATDHAETVTTRDQVGCEFRSRADDDRLVAADDLFERGFGVDVDVEALAQERDSRIRDRFADEHRHSLARRVSRTRQTPQELRRLARCLRPAR